MNDQQVSRSGSPKLGLVFCSLASFLLGFGVCWITRSQAPATLSSGATLPPVASVKPAGSAASSPVARVRPPPPAPPAPPPIRPATPETLAQQWGLQVSSVALLTNGAGMCLTYKVIDPDKVNLLNDDNTAAFILDPSTGGKILLRTPAPLGNVSAHSRARSAALAGQQFWSFPPPRNKLMAGQEYYLLVANMERPLKNGNTVSLVLGDLRLDGLTVE